MSLQDAKFDSAISEMQEMYESELQQVGDPPILHVKEQRTSHKRRGGGAGVKKIKRKKESVGKCAVNVLNFVHEDKVFYVIALRLTNEKSAFLLHLV